MSARPERGRRFRGVDEGCEGIELNSAAQEVRIDTRDGRGDYAIGLATDAFFRPTGTVCSRAEIAQQLNGKTIVKKIIVPGRMVNFVVK